MPPPRDYQPQLALFDAAPPSPRGAGGAGVGAAKERAASAVPKVQLLKRGSSMRSSARVRSEMDRPARPDASGQHLGQCVEAADMLEPTRRAGLFPPERIKPNKFLTREEAYWKSADFEDFKGDIQNAGGNVQPIKVRPVSGQGTIEFEIVFGHRRHRACLDLNLPVYATVEETSDLELFTQTVRENARRRTCSPYSRGVQFRLALDSSLIREDQDWDELFGVKRSMVYKLVKLARLPPEVVQAFDCPSQLQTKWGPPLTQVLKDDREGVLGRAAKLAQMSEPKSPRLVLERLLNESLSAAAATVKEVRIDKHGRTLATLKVPVAATGTLRVALRLDQRGGGDETPPPSQQALQGPAKPSEERARP